MITVKQYAGKMGVSAPAVTMACKAGKKLIGISVYQKIGRDWFLTEEPGSENKRRKPGRIVQ